MIFLKKIFFIGLLGMIFNACSTKEYNHQESIFIVFKTPTFKYADLGFIYRNSEEIKVEIYGSGQALFSLEILKNKVCMGVLSCLSKNHFNEKVLNNNYPNEIIANIFRAKKIFNGKGLKENKNGFIQKIMEQDKYDIEYKVLNKEIIFRDIINNILIKIKKL